MTEEPGHTFGKTAAHDAPRGMYLSASVVIDDDTRILASLGEHPALQLDGAGLGGTLSILLSSGADPVVVADRLFATVTKWRDEIRARAEAAVAELRAEAGR